jgi:hypothetical protein
MRKILSIFSISLLVFFTACDLNTAPEFDDNDAFVAFDNAAMSIEEKGGVIKVPVTLASIKGISAAVDFEIIDGTAKLGENYNLVNETTTLTFDAQNRTQYIEVSIINIPGVFTGDLRFSIKLSEDGTVKPSVENTCVITIQDLDHPLSAFFGEWTATANSHYFGDVEWDVTLAKDEDDISVLWVTDIIYGFPKYGFSYPSYDTRFYGIVSEDGSELSFNIGQTCAYKYQGVHEIFLYGLTGDAKVIKEGKIVAKVSEDGKTITFEELGIYVDDATGYWDGLYPTITWTKK